MNRNSSRLDAYLIQVFGRLRRKIFWNAAAIALGAVLSVTLIAVLMMMRQGFDPDLVAIARVVLAVCVVGIGIVWGFLPLRRLARLGAAAELEKRSPEFNGRMLTYADSRGQDSPLLDLLANDTAKLARRRPPTAVVSRGELALPIAAALSCVLALAALLSVGPGQWKYGARHLLGGWLVAGTLPPQQVIVKPGDVTVGRGTDLRISAILKGFDSQDALLYARFADAAGFESVPMIRSKSGSFEFTVPALRESLSYYVASENQRSPPFSATVVDMPRLEGLELVYRYPEWTGLEDRVQQPGGDIIAVGGTRVTLKMVADSDLDAPRLVVNDEPVRLDKKEGFTATGIIPVDVDGYYYLTARLAGEPVRLSRDYFIKVQPDQPPEVRLVRPGRDWRATSVEEVDVQIEARDDFGLASVEIRYSVNGGDWQSHEIDASGKISNLNHLFFLENMGVQPKPYLDPGDLISYYAAARDRSQENQTDLFFIEVQPFDRQFTQSQQSGSAGGGAGGDDEISQRQKEILVSTWNLIRQKGQKSPGQLQDNSVLLGRLQRTLADQARTLAERVRARQLMKMDDRTQAFVESMELAAEAMEPAASLLENLSLEKAIQPEQSALNHLLRAEALFTEMQISMQGSAGRGAGFQANRDLAELFELEMDLEKNQYETGSRAQQAAGRQDDDELLRQLEELARRQQELANQAMQSPQQMAAERWRQEMLQREAEELRQEMESRLGRQQDQLAREDQPEGRQGGRQQDRQQGQQQGQSAPPQKNQPRGASGAPGRQGEPSADSLNLAGETRRRLDNALRAMEEAAGAFGDESNPQDLQRAMVEAQQQLEQAVRNLQDRRRNALTTDIDEISRAASDLYAEQREVQRQLDEAVRSAMAEEDGPDGSGLSYLMELELAEQKRQMLAELERIQQAMARAAGRSRQDDPATAEKLDDAASEIARSQVNERLAISAAYIESGRALFVAGSEDVTTEALRQLAENLAQAEQLAGIGGGESRDIEDLLAQVRNRRSALQQAAGQGRGDGADWYRTPENDAAGWRPFADWRDLTGVDREDMEQAINQTIGEVLAGVVGSDLLLVSDPEIRRILSEMRQTAARNFRRNPELLAEEYAKAVSLLGQLELALTEHGKDSDSARAAVLDRVDERYRDAAAEYFRRLSNSEDSLP